jgi:hypothetical protein
MMQSFKNDMDSVGFGVLTAVVMKSTHHLLGYDADILLSLFFDPEDGGDMFLRKVG